MKRRSIDAAGLRAGWVYEAIVTTCCGNKAHAAPMGVRFCGGDVIELCVYKTARTCSNLLKKRSFAANFSLDSSLFYKSLYDRRHLVFCRAKEVEAPVLADAIVVLEAVIEDTRDLGDRIVFSSRVVAIRSRACRPPAPCMNRANHLLIECLIKATKLSHLPAGERKKAAREIEELTGTIAKVAPGSLEEGFSRKIEASLRKNGLLQNSCSYRSRPTRGREAAESPSD